jgi:ribosomal protein S18 acetylase RimI-like enzyme
LVQEEDLPDVARFVMNAFGADVISLSQDFNRFEKALMKPTIGLLNAYSGIVAYAEVLSGMQSRTRDRIENPNLDPPDLSGKSREEKLKEAARSSLVLAVGRPSHGSDWHVDVVASVELRLEPCDAKIPFSFPLLDRIERRLASLVGVNHTGRSLRPYLSNLCVDQNYRGKQIGKGLVRCLEDITKSWGYKKLYLHVDLENDAARNLYQNSGYKDVGKRWTPFWAGQAAKIGYYVKKVVGNKEKNKTKASSKLNNSKVNNAEGL